MFSDYNVEDVCSFEHAGIPLQRIPLFQEVEWRNAIVACFGGSASLVMISRGDEPWYSLTVFRGSPWAGPAEFRIGAVGYGGPYPLHKCAVHELSSQGALASLLARVQEVLGDRLIGGTTFPLDIAWDCALFGEISHTSYLSLSCGAEEIFEKIISKSVRTAVRKARKSGVIVQKLTESDLPRAHELLTATQKRVGASYETPLKFLQYLHGIANPGIDFFGAFVNGTMCAFSSFAYGSSDAIHLFNGWNRESANFCPNQLLLWRGITESISRELIGFNFGESHYKSLSEAKSRWGGREMPLVRFKPLGQIADSLCCKK